MTTTSSRHCPTISPPSNSRIADLERAYDRDTWRLFHRIQRARSLQQRHNNNNSQSNSSQDELPNNQHLICSDDLSEEGEDNDRMPTEPEEDEQFLFDMD